MEMTEKVIRDANVLPPAALEGCRGGQRIKRSGSSRMNGANSLTYSAVCSSAAGGRKIAGRLGVAKKDSW
jgi:hypothetical protein